MDKWYHSPPYWRARAEEAKALAKLLDDAEAKASMLAVAEDYERIARRYEKKANAASR